MTLQDAFDRLHERVMEHDPHYQELMERIVKEEESGGAVAADIFHRYLRLPEHKRADFAFAGILYLCSLAQAMKDVSAELHARLSPEKAEG